MTNFLKGVLQNKFPLEGGVSFKDYVILKEFLLNYDNSIKISSQSI
jgi:hypothetical protein